MQRVFYIFLSIFFLLIGCELQEFQEPFRPKIAFYCILAANKPAEARIEYTQGIMDTTAYMLTTRINKEPHAYINPALICPLAKTALFKDGLFVDSLRFNPTTNLYKGNNHIVEPGGQYKIEISVKGLPLIYAETSVPYPVKILRLDTVSTVNNEFNKDTVMHVTLTFKDPPDVSNYYELYGEYYLSSGQNSTYNFYLNGIFENIWEYNVDPAYFSDKLFNGKTISLDLKEDYDGFHIKTWDSLLCFTLSSVSKEEAKYYKSMDRYWYNYNLNNAFAEPVSMYSNIVNGAGIFAGIAESFDTIKVY